LTDLKRLFEEGSLIDRQAAALTAYQSDSDSAKNLLKSYPELLKAIENKELNWSSITPEE
jgi:alpha-D-ribose 1-methylphosphonate 5-triphosphate synthase subunit PhnI